MGYTISEVVIQVYFRRNSYVKVKLTQFFNIYNENKFKLIPLDYYCGVYIMKRERRRIHLQGKPTFYQCKRINGRPQTHVST